MRAGGGERVYVRIVQTLAFTKVRPCAKGMNAVNIMQNQGNVGLGNVLPPPRLQ